jgi:hypothetical protein
MTKTVDLRFMTKVEDTNETFSTNKFFHNHAFIRYSK